jgi:hypothetical protein
MKISKLYYFTMYYLKHKKSLLQQLNTCCIVLVLKYFSSKIKQNFGIDICCVVLLYDF